MTENSIKECEEYIKSGGRAIRRHFGLMEIDTNDASLYMDENRNMTFAQMLMHFIDRSGEKDSEVYKRAFVDRRLFSKIRSNQTYIPSKKTVIALCLALRLARHDTDTLLSLAGYSLSRADDYDLVISFCIEKGIYDLLDINEALYHFGFECF